MNPRSYFFASSRCGRRLVGVVSLATLALLSGCNRLTSYSTHAVGHEITARVEGPQRSIETQPTFAEIIGEYGKVRIERGRVRVDDNTWEQIPVDADITVSIRRGTVRVIAGKVRIERTIRD